MTDFPRKAEVENVRVIRETADALLVEIDGERQTWVPLSQVDDDSEVFTDGDQGTITLSEWWAEKEGLI